MIVTPIRTHKITTKDTDIFKVLDQYLPQIKEKSVIAVTSKIVAICEGRVVAKDDSKDQKDQLAMQEAEYYLPREQNQYGFMITINRGIMVASAGIDESNANGQFVLWPKDPQKSANEIRAYLANRACRQAGSKGLGDIGVIITDSKLTPLRWGVTGVALAHSGFNALNSYIGKPDIFGRVMQAEKSNIADSLATAAVTVMGEGAEQQPLAVIEDLSFVQFQKRNPTQQELESLKISLDEDVYSSLITSVEWKKGSK